MVIDEITFTFGPDEEGGYHALINPEQIPLASSVSIILIQSVADKLAKFSN